MGFIEHLKLKWKTMTAAEKAGVIFKGTAATATVIGACVCVHETRKCRDILDYAVQKADDKLDIEISQDLIDEAVAKAADKQIAAAVKVAVDREWKDVQEETRTQVRNTVKDCYGEITDAIGERLAKECESLHRTDIVNSIRDKAKDKLAEKLDDKLDQITDEYSKNLTNMGKVYEALADKLNSKA